MKEVSKEISPWRNRHIIETEPVKGKYVSRSADGNEPELKDYFDVLFKHRRFIIAVFLTVLAIGAYFSFTATRLYQANAMLKIEPQNPSVTGVGEMLRLESGVPTYDYYQTQFKLLESRTLAAKVIAELKLESNKLFTSAQITTSRPTDRVTSWIIGALNFVGSLIPAKQPETPQEELDTTKAAANYESTLGKAEASNNVPTVAPWLIGRYKQFLTVKPVKNTRLVEVVFSTPNGGLSQMLANAHARAFIQLSSENSFALTKEARDFLEAKNVELKEKLERSENALNRFRQTYGVVSMEKGENVIVERLVDFNRQLTVARGQRIEAESLYKIVENKSSQSLSQVVTQGMVPTLRTNLLALEAEKIKVSTVFKPDHPRMLELNQQITEMKRSLNNEINNVVRGIQENYFAARAKEQALEAEAQKQQQTALSLKQAGVQYAVLEEEVKVNRTLYESVLKRLSETNVSNDIAVSNMQIVQKADRPMGPFTPNIPLNLFVSALLGLFLGVGLAFVRDWLDSSLDTAQEVWHAVGLSTFGVIPDLGSLNHRLLSYDKNWRGKFLPKTSAPSDQPTASASKELIVSHHPLSMLAESYRNIRTALLLSQPETPPKVILLTSPSPCEGKTLTTLNLAIALAQDGHRVLVIDADLRRGCCDIRLGITNHRGLSNLLTGNLSLEEAVQSTNIHGLSLLSRGVPPPNPTDLLGSQKMRQVLRTLRESFDFILIDSPPAIGLSDAVVLSVVCDGVLLVFHGRKTTTVSARQAMERLDAARAPFLGAILNGINLDHPEYAYYRSYSKYYQSPSENGHAHNPSLGARQDSDDPVARLSNILEKTGFTGALRKTFVKGEGETAQNVSRQSPYTETSEEASSITFPATENDLNLEHNRGATSREKFGSPKFQLCGVLPKEFVERLITVFGYSMGPMAPLVVRDHIAALGELQDAFPKSRIAELIDRMAPEIFDERQRAQFCKDIGAEVRALENI